MSTFSDDPPMLISIDEDITFRKLEILLAFMETGNLARAAERLDISTVSVHRALHSLETGMRCALFRHEGRNLHPTDAAHTLAEWDKESGEKLPLYVGVNLSAIQVARDDIAGVVQSALKSSGLTGDRLSLELTESSIVQDPARATRVFDALKALDATVAMDDFGTGYSSLAYLQRLPIDVLKIDKSFVSGMMVDPDAVAIVRAVLSLAEALGMSTTAEGIETVELATTLATLGCGSGQGFYFARPLEADQALKYWKSRQR